MLAHYLDWCFLLRRNGFRQDDALRNILAHSQLVEDRLGNLAVVLSVGVLAGVGVGNVVEQLQGRRVAEGGEQLHEQNVNAAVGVPLETTDRLRLPLAKAAQWRPRYATVAGLLACQVEQFSLFRIGQSHESLSCRSVRDGQCVQSHCAATVPPRRSVGKPVQAAVDCASCALNVLRVRVTIHVPRHGPVPDHAKESELIARKQFGIVNEKRRGRDESLLECPLRQCPVVVSAGDLDGAATLEPGTVSRLRVAEVGSPFVLRAVGDFLHPLQSTRLVPDLGAPHGNSVEGRAITLQQSLFHGGKQFFIPAERNRRPHCLSQ